MSNFKDSPLVIYSNEVASFVDGASFDSGFIDMAEYSAYKVTVRLDDISGNLTLSQTFKLTDSGDETVLSFPLTTVTAGGDFASFTASTFERFLKLGLTNNTGGTATNVKFQVQLLPQSSNNATVTTLASSPVNQSQALLTQSVLIGEDTEGVFRNTKVNQAGAILTSDFGTEVARGLFEGVSIKTKFGRNPDIDISSAPEDMWNGGASYTGFNATANQNIEVFSADANDSGSLVSSGTATGGSSTTLIDTGATFVSDGVAVGDLVINDTQGIHGVITVVDSETQVTVFRMQDGGTSPTNASGDSYRIATADDTGAAVVKLPDLLNNGFVEQTARYVIMNGTTGVTVTGDYARCPRVQVILAGSSGLNEGVITVRQATTTANVFAQMPTKGQSTIGAFSVPSGKNGFIKRIRIAIVRASGAAGSANVDLRIRPFGQAWRSIRSFELQTGATTEFTAVGGSGLLPGTDVKFTIASVSDNNTIAEGAMEYFLFDEA